MTRPSGTPALALLQARGVAHTVHTYAIDEPTGAAAHRGERTPYGVAAAALGVSPARLFTTLVLVLEGGRAGGELVLASARWRRRSAQSEPNLRAWHRSSAQRARCRVASAPSAVGAQCAR